MWKNVSNTAEYGGRTRGPKIITPETKATMKEILKDIQDGKFADEWVKENEEGTPLLNSLKEEGKKHQIEKVGERLRQMMKL
jgi:ketol-acid reductoisomerase